MKKNKEWAFIELGKLFPSHAETNDYSDNIIKYELLNKVYDILTQLDEPETLSLDWIDENKKDSGVHYIGYYVPIGRLHDLLVPKQEEVDRAYKDGYEKGREHGFYKGYREGLANKGGEPEVLSQEWIEGNSVYASSDGVTEEYVHVDDLQNLLVPKQELPVIPKFVAEWIEETKPYNSLRVAFEYIAQRKRDNHDDELAFWVEEGNSETFARAWLYGFTVEEQKYYAVKKEGLDGVHYYFTKFDDEMNGLFTLPHDKKGAHRFDDKEKAQAIANYTDSKVEELEK